MIEKENLALIPDAYNEEEDEIQEEDDINDANFWLLFSPLWYTISP